MSQRQRLEKQRTALRQAVSHLRNLTVTPHTHLGRVLEINEYYSGYITTEGVWIIIGPNVVTKQYDTVLEGYKCLFVRELTLEEQSVVMSESWSRSKNSKEVFSVLSEIPRVYAS